MRGFVLRENIRRLSALDPAELSASERRHVDREIMAMRRELALFDAATLGAQRYPFEFGRAPPRLAHVIQQAIDGNDDPTMIVDPRPGLHIIDVNAAHAAATFQIRDRVAGQRLFDVFPDNPALDTASGVIGLFDSIRSACTLRRPVASRPTRYDVRDPSGEFVPRYWQTVSIPITTADGELSYILHTARDVTAYQPAPL